MERKCICCNKDVKMAVTQIKMLLYNHTLGVVEIDICNLCLKLFSKSMQHCAYNAAAEKFNAKRISKG